MFFSYFCACYRLCCCSHLCIATPTPTCIWLLSLVFSHGCSCLCMAIPHLLLLPTCYSPPIIAPRLLLFPHYYSLPTLPPLLLLLACRYSCCCSYIFQGTSRPSCCCCSHLPIVIPHLRLLRWYFLPHFAFCK